jgi:hypothetical protein
MGASRSHGTAIRADRAAPGLKPEGNVCCEMFGQQRDAIYLGALLKA